MYKSWPQSFSFKFEKFLKKNSDVQLNRFTLFVQTPSNMRVIGIFYE